MIVMKFGGTSVEDAAAIERVAVIVRDRLARRPVVVVSAMAKVTDQLVAAGRAASFSKLDEALEHVNTLRARHDRAARELLTHESYFDVRPRLDLLLDSLEQLLRGVAAVGELSPRSSDYVLSFGEMLSSILVTSSLHTWGIGATHVDSRQCVITDAGFTHALPVWDETNTRLRSQVQPLVDAARVPVMGGFIASTREGIPTTLGRGGSDFSAAIVGAALGAEAIEIWTDVEGMMTTDPRLAPNARTIPAISFEEAAEMAYFGAKVLHPATLVPAVEKNIPVYVLNSRNPQSTGTCIRRRAPRCRTLFRAVAAKKNLTILNITAPRMLGAHGFLKAIFDAFDRHRIPVEIVSTSEVSVSLTCDSTLDISRLLTDLRAIADVSVEREKAIVAVIGSDLRGKVGVAAKVFSTVAAAGVNVRMISQGASEINISFVINEADVPVAVRHLHEACFEQAPARRNNRKEQMDVAVKARELALGGQD